jgi:hypothetical protein
MRRTWDSRPLTLTTSSISVRPVRQSYGQTNSPKCLSRAPTWRNGLPRWDVEGAGTGWLMTVRRAEQAAVA